MRGYVEMMERLAYNMPEGREPTDAEVCAALADFVGEQADYLRLRAEIPQTPGEAA